MKEIEVICLPSTAVINKPLRFSGLMGNRQGTIGDIFNPREDGQFGLVTVTDFDFPLIIDIRDLIVDKTQVRSAHLPWLLAQLSFLSLERLPNHRLKIAGVDMSTAKLSDAFGITSRIELSSLADVIYALLARDKLFEPKAVSLLIEAIAPRLLAKLNVEYEAYLAGEKIHGQKEK